MTSAQRSPEGGYAVWRIDAEGRMERVTAWSNASGRARELASEYAARLGGSQAAKLLGVCYYAVPIERMPCDCSACTVARLWAPSVVTSCARGVR